MYILCFYVPEADVDIVKNALFTVGAGRIGNYDSCAWQTPGRGQFRPLVGSEPHIGVRDMVSHVDEFKVELVCEDHLIKTAIETLLAAHPYEEPAYHAVKVTTLADL